MTGNPDFDRLAGLRADLPVNEKLTMRVTIVDVRRAYGRTDVQVVPVDGDSGRGAAWVDVHKLKRLGTV